MTREWLGPTGRMENGPIGTCGMEKGPSGDFYDELQASWMSKCRSHRYYDKLQASRMSNYRSHRYTSDGEGSIGTRRMEKGSSRDFYDEL